MSCSILKIFICIFCFIMLSPYSGLPIDEDDAPKVTGPVPEFTNHLLENKRSERWYYSINYPQFGIKNIDDVLLNYVEEMTEAIVEKAELGKKL